MSHKSMAKLAKKRAKTVSRGHKGDCGSGTMMSTIADVVPEGELDMAEFAKRRAAAAAEGRNLADIAQEMENDRIKAKKDKKGSDLADLNGTLRDLKPGNKADNLAPDQRGK